MYLGDADIPVSYIVCDGQVRIFDISCLLRYRYNFFILETFRVLFAKPAHQLISQSYANCSTLYSKWSPVVVSLLHYRLDFFVHILLYLHELSTFCAFDSLLTFDNHCLSFCIWSHSFHMPMRMCVCLMSLSVLSSKLYEFR